MKIVKNIQRIAQQVLIHEGKSILNLVDQIDSQFEESVQAIYTSAGRVVITGIGKSAIIASKIVATLNSTGTPALYMHAADAVHGDLGMVQDHDIVIAVSKSGNTPEMKSLVPILKRRDTKLIALVGDIKSYLATEADFILNATVDGEACPNNLAPTTSTTAQLAMGDALAVALLELRQFSPQDFARYHPGGVLGKRLYLRVSDLMKRHQLPHVEKDALVRNVIVEISTKRLGAVAVVDSHFHLEGVITDGDLRRMLEHHTDISTITADLIMTRHPKWIGKDEFAVQAVHVMQHHNISQLVVKDKEKVVGFIHLHDLLQEGII